MPKGLEAALQRVGATASFGPIAEAVRCGLKATADAVVVVGPIDGDSGADGLRALFDHVAAHPRATLVLGPEGDARTQWTHPAAVPVSFGDWSDERELAARIATMIEMRPSLELLHRRTAGRQQADEILAERYREQVRLAGQVQRELLPRTLPRYGNVSFSTVYRPIEYVSGDIYDIRRLDDEHVAVALVDAQGHGIHAALLTVFVKRALRGEGQGKGGARLPKPAEVLAQLNEELLETELSACQFTAAVYVVLNVRTRTVELARGGAPYPVRRRADGRCELVRPDGMLIGVLPEATFETASFELAPGESLVLYSDGIDHVVRSAGPAPREAAAVLTTRRRRHPNGLVPPSQARGAVGIAVTAAAPARQRGTGAAHCVGAFRPSNRVDGSAEASRHTDAADATDPAVAPDELITTTSWYRRLGNEGVESALEWLACRHDTLRRIGQSVDDLTALAINVDS
jgi:hypothetical protein